MTFSRTDFPVVSSPKTLVWQGDSLVDYLADSVYELQDHVWVKEKKLFYHAPFYPFDKVVISPSGQYYVCCSRLGTKGVIYQKDHTKVREINRSYYCADAYDYPVTFLQDLNGQEFLIHCPEEYNVLQIEEVTSGRCLTKREGKSSDFFHSRLQVSPSGRYLLSAGWVWHPVDVVNVFDIQQALSDPSHLDHFYIMLEGDGVKHLPDTDNDCSATFTLSDQLLISSQSDESSTKPTSHFLLSINLDKKEVNSVASLAQSPGMIMPIGESHIIAFSSYPQLIEIATGQVIHTWPDLACKIPITSIMRGSEPEALRQLSCIALDPKNRRFAMIKDEKNIAVISFT